MWTLVTAAVVTLGHKHQSGLPSSGGAVSVEQCDTEGPNPDKLRRLTQQQNKYKIKEKENQ